MASLVAENYLEATIQSSIFPASGIALHPCPEETTQTTPSSIAQEPHSSKSH